MKAIFAFLLALIQKALGLGAKIAPDAKVVTHVAGKAVTISFATAEAGLIAAMAIDWQGIKRAFDKGQVVTAGLMTIDDALQIIAPFVPQAAMAEQVVHLLVSLGQISLAHNSGEGGIGAPPEGQAGNPWDNRQGGVYPTGGI